jgi:hypothetical protein
VATFVLVHGAWHGAWCWRRVARVLTRSGHEVFAPTLTGLAERSHLLSPAVDLDTHILDVVNEMKWAATGTRHSSVGGSERRNDRSPTDSGVFPCQREGPRVGRRALHAAAAEMFSAATDADPGAGAHCQESLHQSDRLPERTVRSRDGERPREGLASP